VAYAIIHFFPGGTREQYEEMLEELHPGKGQLPAGQTFHSAGPSAGGWTIMAVHDSKESWDRFVESAVEPWKQRGRKRAFQVPPQEIAFEVYNAVP
jgi:hypothetical protein